MKKIFTTALLALLGAGAFAQTSQGTVSVSGSVGFRNESSKTDGTLILGKTISRSSNFSPSTGYFLRDGLELGIGLGLSQSTYTQKYKDNDGESKSRTQAISFSPYVRKYIALTEQLQLHGTGYISADYGNSKFRDRRESSYKETSTSSGYGLGFYPGVTYFATPKLGFTATFGTFSYSRGKSTSKDNQNQNTPYISNSFKADLSPSSIGIGIGYFIAR
jgi:hypothetical protein